MTINRDEAIADLRATVDYLAGLVDGADSVDFETATDLRDEALRVKKVAGDLAALLEGELLTKLEAGSRDYGNRTWVRRKKYVERHDHTTLLNAARDRAIQQAYDAERNEIDPDLYARHLISWFKNLYLSSSTKAKVTVADELGVDRSLFVEREHKGYELMIVEHDERDA